MLFRSFIWLLEPASRAGLVGALGMKSPKWLVGRLPLKPAKTGNIYHILVDGYAAHSFPDAMDLGGLSGNGRVEKARLYLKEQLKKLKLASIEAV